MYKASFMVLKRLWSSLPKMVKLSIVTLWPEMLTWSCMGDGALRCSLYLSSKFLADSPIYSSSQSTLSHLYLYMTPLFLRNGSLSFGAISWSLMVYIGLFCCYFFWCWPARLVCWPLQPGNMWYTIVGVNVEVASIYRYNGKEPQPTRPHENHGLDIEHLPTWPEGQCKQQLKSLVVPVQGSFEKSSKIQGTPKCT